MALYGHVKDKDDLLDEVADRLLAGAWQPRCRTAPWRPWTTEAAERFRKLLVAQPAVLHVYLRHPVVSPIALERMNAALRVLENAGFDERAARRTYAAIHTYTIGFAALEATRADWASAHDVNDVTMRELASFTKPRQFADGLDYLLDGIELGRKS